MLRTPQAVGELDHQIFTKSGGEGGREDLEGNVIIVDLAYDSSPASQVPSRRNRDVLASEMSGFHFKVTLHEFTIKFIYKTIQKYPRLQLKKIRHI